MTEREEKNIAKAAKKNTDLSLTRVRQIWTAETETSNFVPSQLSTEERRDLLREQAKMSRAFADHLSLVQGEILYEIFAQGFYKDWGFTSFKDYVEQELEFKTRKASYLVSIYSKFIVELGADPAVVISIPWSRLKELLAVVNAKNVDRLLEYALDHSVSDIKKLAAKEQGSSPSSVTSCREVFVLSEDQRGTIKAAMDAAELATGSDKRGYLLDVIASEFLSSNLAQNPDRMTLLQTVEDHIATLKRVYGVELVVRSIDDTVPAFREDDE